MIKTYCKFCDTVTDWLSAYLIKESEFEAP